MLSLKLMTPPVHEPVTLEEAKAWLKIETADEDATITRLIATARQMVEHYTRRALLAQTWRLMLDRPQAVPFVLLPKAPTLKIVAAFMQGGDGLTTALDLSGIGLDADSDPQRLILRPLCLNALQATSAVGFDIVFGYGEESSSVPEALRQAVLVLVAQGYEQRAVVDMQAANPVLPLLAPYVLRRLS